MNWEKAPKDILICQRKSIDKTAVVRAIARGADTVEKVGEATGACVNADCCAEKVQGLLDAYLPAFERMKNASGCSCGNGCCG